jgi:diguanylate cyclase
MAGAAALLGGVALWLRKHPDPARRRRHHLLLNVGFVFAYLCFAATVAGIDQLVTPNITPYLVAALGTAVFLPLPAVPLTLAHLLAFAVFAVAITTFAAPGPAGLSNLLNGFTVALTAWAIGRALRTARARNTAQAVTIEAQQSALANMNIELQRLADLDGLTGLPNRRSLLERSEQMRAHAARHREALALILIDVDHFKDVNDELGHARGDEVLVAVVGACKSQLRGEDILGRFGGEEFAALLPQCTADGARRVAERMRAEVETLAIAHPNGAHLTISVGLSVVRPEANGAIDAALAAADVSLYEAKRSGRNRVGPLADG